MEFDRYNWVVEVIKMETPKRKQTNTKIVARVAGRDAFPNAKLPLVKSKRAVMEKILASRKSAYDALAKY